MELSLRSSGSPSTSSSSSLWTTFPGLLSATDGIAVAIFERGEAGE